MTFFYQMRACRPSPAGWLAGWLAAAAQGLCITINSTGLAAAWADTVTSQQLVLYICSLG